MSSFFSDVMTDMKGMEQNLLGPDYLYWKRILKPSDMGMSADGNFGALTNDVNGLINYVEVLVTGNAGSTTGGPLGDKFFLKTGGQCTDVASGKKVDRFILTTYQMVIFRSFLRVLEAPILRNSRDLFPGFWAI